MGRFLDLVADFESKRKETAASPEPPEPANLADAVEDLREHWAERAAILEYDAGLPRAQAEDEASVMTATLARNRGYPWRALRLALAERPDLAAQVPDTLDPVDQLLWGVPRLAILPTRRVIPQGRVRP